MDMLVLADRDGVVDMTHEALARYTNVPADVVREAIIALESPDPESRNPDHQGARIVRLDSHRTWGWMIVNYERYRIIGCEEQRREKTRNRVHKLRKNPNDLPLVTQCNADVTPCNAPVTLGNACNAKYKHKHKEEDIVPLAPLPLPPEVEHWNANCGTLPKVLRCTAARLRHLKSRREDSFWVANFPSAVNKAAGSGFCTGKNDRGWVATFDWLIKSQDTVTKLIEGTYDHKPHSNHNSLRDRNAGTCNEGCSGEYATFSQDRRDLFNTQRSGAGEDAAAGESLL